MAAPSSTKWSSVYGSGTHEAKLGIYYTTSGSDTSVDVYVEVWFWSEYTCYDQYNTLYFSIGEDVTAATTNRGDVSINCTSSSQWSTSNQKKIYSDTFTFNRYSTSRTINMYAKLDTVEYIYKSPMRNNTSFKINPATTYTITYDANGGSGAPSSQTKTHGTTLTLRTGKPTRTGYDFVNWKSTQNGTVYYFNPGDKTSYNGNQTLYAQWKKKTYTVKYDANGGSGAPSSQTKTYGTDLTLSSTKPKRTGYTFDRWKSTRSDGSVYYYSAGSTTTYNGNQTLYAQWTGNTYTISYDANGGSNAPSAQTKSYGLAMTISSKKPTRAGYTFLGWHTSSTAVSPLYYAGGKLASTFNVSDTLYAVWELEERVDIEIITESLDFSGRCGKIGNILSDGTIDTNILDVQWKTIAGETDIAYYVSLHQTDNLDYTAYSIHSRSGPYQVSGDTQSSTKFSLKDIMNLTGDIYNIKFKYHVYTETSDGKSVSGFVDVPVNYFKPRILSAMPVIKDGEITYIMRITTNAYSMNDNLSDIYTPTIVDDLGGIYVSQATKIISDKEVEFTTIPVALSDAGLSTKLYITISDGIFEDKMTVNIPKFDNIISYNSTNQTLSAPLLIEDDVANSFEFRKGGVIKFREYIESDEILDSGFSMGNTGIIASNINEE